MLESSKPSLPGLQTWLCPCSPLPSLEKVFHCVLDSSPWPSQKQHCLLHLLGSLSYYSQLCCPTVVSAVSSLQPSKATLTSVSLLLTFQSVSYPPQLPLLLPSSPFCQIQWGPCLGHTLLSYVAF